MTHLAQLSDASILPAIDDDNLTLIIEDAVRVLPLLVPGSVDSVVTDPPYGLEFCDPTAPLGVFQDSQTRRKRTRTPHRRRRPRPSAPSRVGVRGLRHRQRTHEYFLKGSLCCRCGSRMSITNSKGRNGDIYPYFFCLGRQRRNGCHMQAVLVTTIEQLVEDN